MKTTKLIPALALGMACALGAATPPALADESCPAGGGGASGQAGSVADGLGQARAGLPGAIDAARQALGGQGEGALQALDRVQQFLTDNPELIDAVRGKTSVDGARTLPKLLEAAQRNLAAGNTKFAELCLEKIKEFLEAALGIVGGAGQDGQVDTLSGQGAAGDQGELFRLGDSGPQVADLQRRLQAMGHPVGVTGTFDQATQTAVRRFQTAQGIAVDGIVGPQTRGAFTHAEGGNRTRFGDTRQGQALAPSALRGSGSSIGSGAPSGSSSRGSSASTIPGATPPPSASGPVGGATASGQSLASAAARVAGRRGTTGRCFAGVAEAVTSTHGSFLHGKSAYMAADQLAARSDFREVNVSGSALRQLPPGAIVVWGKTARSPHGHISVSLGDGREASDHVATQRLQLRGDSNPRVFVPR